MKVKTILGVVIVLFIILGGMFYLGFGQPKPLVIHGYDGPVATIHSMDDCYADDPMLTYRETHPTSSCVYPIAPDVFDIATQSGMRIEIQGGINVLSTEIIDTIEKYEIDDATKTNITQTWEVQKVKCSMGITVATHSGGLADTPGVTWWIMVEENAYSVFSTAEESEAYIINVYTRELTLTEGDLEVVPTAKGADFPIVPIAEVDAPQWLLDSGYTSNLRLFDIIKFPIQVLRGHAAIAYNPLPYRIDAYSTFDIGLDIILFGYWEQVKDVRDWGWPEWPNLFRDLANALILIGGVVISVIILWKVPRYWKIVGLAVVWLLIGVYFGWFDSILGVLGA